MKKDRVIFDNSVWIEYFREKEKVADYIERELMEGRVYMVGPVVSELLQGVMNSADYNELRDCIDAVPFVESSLNDWKKAGKISGELRKDGLTIPLTDIFIAAVAINREMKVYSFDVHFKEIPGVKLFEQRLK